MSGRFLLRKVGGRFDAIRREMRSVIRAATPAPIWRLALALALWCLAALALPIALAGRMAVRSARTVATIQTQMIVGSMLVDPFLLGAAGASGSKTITIDHTKCGTADSTDFYVQIAGTYSYLADVGHGGQLTSVNNLAFYSDAGLTTLLKFARIKHDLTTGAIVYGAKIATLSHTVDPVFYMGWDTSVTDRADPTNVGDTNQHGIYPIEDASFGNGTTVHDVTVGHNMTMLTTGGATPTATTGILGQAVDTGTTGVTNMGITASGVTTPYSFHFWYTPNAAPGTVTPTHLVLLGVNSGSGGWEWDHNNAAFRGAAFHQQSNGTFIAAKPTTTFSGGTRYCLDATHGAGGLKCYINGALETTSSTNGTMATITGDAFRVINGNYGVYDEVRLDAAERSADWILARYNNEFSPSTFYAVT